ncbi:medium-chain acyl-CoA ligase ACSF2, mitochondrial-like [Anneissia japonica]|uniref:medium-chain acyl-CoA ligase ACSF2, mitochondrial-like n=1 Tax=Anneissia japonica TaxID=1529436 RepID=UPI001425A05F|nr:medium-chain acyl-CoA ligase ACSF2, mitochondrial-like [Anneissia japonica]
MELSRNKSYVHTPGNEPFIGLTMYELLKVRVEKHPDREMHVFVDDNERITFAEYRRKIIDLAAGFLNIGFSKGDCIAVLGGNHMEWPLIIGAAQSLGVIVVCLQIGNTLKTLKEILLKTSCKALFITRSPETLYSDVCTMIAELNTSTVNNLHSIDIPNLKMVIAAGANNQSGTISFECISVRGCEEKVCEAARKVTIDDVSFMAMTSGTTGIPKLAAYSFFQMINGSEMLPTIFDNQVNILACAGNTAYAPSFLFGHVGPLVLGSTSVYPSPMYSFEKFVQAVQIERCTSFMLMINGIIDLAYSPINEKYDLSSLKAGFCGGSLIPAAVVTHLKKTLGICALIDYGHTEVNSVCCLRVDDKPDTYTTVGKPFPHVEVQIVNESGITLEVGKTGEIWVRSPFAFKGYYDDVKKTNEVVTKDGWFQTGDLGKLNSEGYLTVVGRIQDIIIKNGQNIHPSVVEIVLSSHPSVKKAKVVGIPDYRVGEDVCACVVVHGCETVNEEDIHKYCVEKVQKSYIPTYVLMFDSFPLGISRKVDQRKLQKMAIARIDIPAAPYADD